MRKIKQLPLTILNAIKAYCKKFFKDVRDLQDEMIKFDKEYEKQMWGDKK